MTEIYYHNQNSSLKRLFASSHLLAGNISYPNVTKISLLKW